MEYRLQYRLWAQGMMKASDSLGLDTFTPPSATEILNSGPQGAQSWMKILKSLGIDGKVDYQQHINQEMISFFNSLKTPFLIDGAEKADFGVNINRIGTTPGTLQARYEFELYTETKDPAMMDGRVKTILGRVGASWDGTNLVILSKEVVDPELKQAYEMYHK